MTAAEAQPRATSVATDARPEQQPEPAPADAPPPRSILVVGAGLIGTSAGLALRAAGVEVFLDDRDTSRVALAVELGAGQRWSGEGPDHVIVATPPAAVAPVIASMQRRLLNSTFSDVAGVKTHLAAEVQQHALDAIRFVGGHPLAGRERAGPAAARRDLFRARPWVLTPLPGTGPRALAHARSVAEMCGAVPVVMTPEEHDAAVALVSHTPQLVASALAALLADGQPVALGLAGTGLRDTTRIADSDPALWADVVATNAEPVAAQLDRLITRLEDVRARLRGTRAQAAAAVHDLVTAGRTGRGRLPGRHNAPATPQAVVRVVVRDAPGELARVLDAVAQAAVNLEDLAIEHGVGEPLGVIELVVAASDATDLVTHLSAGGWSVHA